MMRSQIDRAWRYQRQVDVTVLALIAGKRVAYACPSAGRFRIFERDVRDAMRKACSLPAARLAKLMRNLFEIKPNANR